MRHRRSRAARLLRRFTLGSGPLKRRSDRLEVLGRCLVLALLLAAVPVTLLVATGVAAGLRAEAAAQAAQRHQVTASLAADVPLPTDANSDYPQSVVAWVTWRDGSGLHVTPASVLAGTKAGAPVLVWLDRRGRVSAPPLDDDAVTAQAVGAGLVVACGTWTVVMVGHLIFRLLLDRRRLRQWELDWAVVEPRWSGKVS